MVVYGVKRGNPLIFNKQDKELIHGYIIESCDKFKINVLKFNVLADHVHMVLEAYDIKDLSEKVRKIKGASSFKYQRHREWTKGQHVWARKYHKKLILDDKALENILHYVEYNHLKHDNPWGEED